MSLKVKLTSLITTFVLLCSLLTVGVFAVKNTTFNVGGDIVFNVQGIEADIELTTNGVQNAEFNNDEEIGKDVLSKIQIRNNTSADAIASQFATWSNLDMTFADGATTATIEFKITNMASEEDNYIDITSLADATTKNNARIKVANNAGGITALLKSGEDATFTITFSVKDDGYSASLNGFSVNFDMQKKVLADFPTKTDEEAKGMLSFTCTDSTKSASVSSNSGVSGAVVIPRFIRSSTDTICEVKTIGGYAFYTRKGVTSVEIPLSVTSIGGSAFRESGLTSITIPSSVTSIGYQDFSTCRGLESIVVEEGNSIYDSRENCNAIIETATNTLIQGCNNSIIPNTVTSIANQAFFWCSYLTSITIPESVTSIGDYAFTDCENLTNITIPDSVISIGKSAFSDCKSFTTVNYTGTEEQWNALLENVGSDNGALINATFHFGE